MIKWYAFFKMLISSGKVEKYVLKKSDLKFKKRSKV